MLPAALYLDLLDSSLYFELSQNPHKLEAISGNLKRGDWVVVDEIQKIPLLLDEVHRLIEERKWRFVLCGSSARKLRRGGVNLLGGRAITINLEGFTSFELDNLYDIDRAIKWGTLPLVQFNLANVPTRRYLLK